MAETEPTTHTPRPEIPGDPMCEDMARRWMASDRQRAAALALLASLPEEYRLCIVPLVLVNKRHSWWTEDVVVEHVHAYFPSTNRGHETPDPRTLAEDAAYAALGKRMGTTSWCVIWRDGHAAVFEGFHSNEEEQT